MNRPFTMRAGGLERHRFSVGDVDCMIGAGVLDAEGRWELIDGEVVPMAATYASHGRMALRLARLIDKALDASRFELFAGVTVELGDLTRVDLDLFVARAGLAAKIVPASAVLWAIEISDATRWKDLSVKAPLYAAAGIPEFWVVDLEQQTTHVHRGPSASGWTKPVIRMPFGQAIAPEEFPECTLTILSV
jgi:Uma2 family endonuclease